MLSREQQIASLVEVPGLQCVVKDVRWKVQLQPPSRHICTIWLDLSRHFPNSAPEVSVYPNITHPWVDTRARVVGHSMLRPWNSHYRLGQLIIDMIQEISGVIFQQQSFMDEAGLQPQTRGPKMPTIPRTFPELEQLSLSELEILEANDAALRDWAEKLDLAKKYEDMSAELHDSNYTIATETLAKKEGADKLSARYAALLEEVQQERYHAEEALARQKLILQRYDRPQLAEALAHEMRKSDVESELLMNDAIAGTNTSDIRVVLAQYKELRKVTHRMGAKYEKLLSMDA